MHLWVPLPFLCIFYTRVFLSYLVLCVIWIVDAISMEVRLVPVEYWGSSSRRCTMGVITEVDSSRPGGHFKRDSPGHGKPSPGDFLPVLVGSVVDGVPGLVAPKIMAPGFY
ncbi:hypothetical protein JTB14_013516 [Gonioctena quinquepunctata]|nr:hypothetical protein JTB14_013516 [Gonioctena quinquepunctata]